LLGCNLVTTIGLIRYRYRRIIGHKLILRLRLLNTRRVFDKPISLLFDKSKHACMRKLTYARSVRHYYYSIYLSFHLFSFIRDAQLPNRFMNILTHLYPVRMFSSVDFPAPEGPIIAVSSPDRSLPLTDFRIVFTSENATDSLVPLRMGNYRRKRRK